MTLKTSFFTVEMAVLSRITIKPYIATLTHTHTHTCVYAGVCMYVYISMCAYIYIYMNVCVYIYIYIHIYIYIYIYMGENNGKKSNSMQKNFKKQSNLKWCIYYEGKSTLKPFSLNYLYQGFTMVKQVLIEYWLNIHRCSINNYSPILKSWWRFIKTETF